jgi:hypothetical protein
MAANNSGDPAQAVTGRVVNLLDTNGLLIDGLALPSHAATVCVAVNGCDIDARAYALDHTHTLIIARELAEYEEEGELITVELRRLRSARRTTGALRDRLARLMELPEESLDAWDDRQVRHGLLFVLEAAAGALRDQRLVALEAALGSRTTL